MKKIFTMILLVSLTAGLFALPNLLKKEQYGATSIDNLDFSLTSEDIHIKETSDTTSIDVEIYCNYKKYAPEVSVSGSTLYIEGGRKGVHLFPDPTGFSCTVIVYVPQKKDFDEISIQSTSGDIVTERALSAKTEIKLQITSGEITVENGLFADDIKISGTSGDIDLYNIDADTFKVNASSGDITVRKFTGGTGTLHSTSGDIKASDFASEYASFQSTSGGISVKKLDCDYFDADTTSGGVSIELENAPTASSALESTSGDVNLYLPMRAKFSVDVSCSSGTFRDKFNNNRMNPRDSYKMDYNGGGATIKIRTTSGDITVEY